MSKNKNVIIGYQVEIKPRGARFYTDYMGFYFTREQAKAQARNVVLLDGEAVRIKTIKAI